MNKESFKFDNVQIDRTKYSLKFAELENEGAEFVSAIQALKENGLPVTENFICEHCMTDKAIRLYFNEQAKQEIEDLGGFFADDEAKNEIVAKFTKILKAIEIPLAVVRDTLKHGRISIIWTKNGVAFDKAYNSNAAKLFSEYCIDGKKLEEYHNLAVAMFRLRQEIRKFEDANGMSHNHFCSGEKVDYAEMVGESALMRFAVIDDYFKSGDSADLWLRIFGKFFTKPFEKNDEKGK